VKNVEDIYELAPMQQGMLFDSLAVNVPSMYRVHLAYNLQGDIDVAAFRRAWQYVTRRHPVMRTSFHWDGLEKPLQVVHQDLELPLDEKDWSGLSEEEQVRRLRELVLEEQTRPSDLSSPPLMRLTLFRTSETGYWFLWSLHHMLIEGWSVSIVLKEVFTCYRAFARGEEPELEPPVPYRSLIQWLQQQDEAAAEAFWRDQLRGFEAATRLPADRSGGSVQSAIAQYANEYVRLPEAATEALNAFARTHQVTLNSLVRAAWAALLARYSGEREVVFGAIVSGRSAPIEGIESMVGMSVNIVPVRVPVPEDEALLSWLRSIHEQQLAMQPFEHCALMQVKQWSDAPRGRPLFDTLLIFENWVGEVHLREWSDLFKLRDFRFAQVGQGYPITVEVTPGPQLRLAFLYDERRFDAESVRRMLQHFRMLLETIPVAAERPVRELPRLTPDDRRTQLDRWSGATRPARRDPPVHQRFEEQVRQTPDAIALMEGDQRLSYAQLNERANRLAHRLRSLGVGPEVIVGICMERSPDLVTAMLATLKAGGAYLPLDPAYPRARLEFMLRDAGVGVLLTQESLVGALPHTDARVLAVDAEREALAGEPTGDPAVELGASNLAYVIYTSGSTGEPKGVLIEHGSLANFVHAASEAFEVQPQDRVLQFASISFDTAAEEIFPCLTRGATLVLRSDAMLGSMRGFLDFCEKWQVSILDLPTAFWHELVESLASDALELPAAVRLVIIGGERAVPGRLAAWREHVGDRPRLVNTYGPTEATVVATLQDLSAAVRGSGETAEVPVGRPLPGVRTYVLDEALEPVPVGAVGQLHVGGAAVARGYLARPELTAEKFVADPFSDEPGARLYRTGDLACYRTDGTLEFRGRVDHQVKLRGYRIETGEIESHLQREPGVRDAVVHLWQDADGDGRLIAYLVPEPGAELLADALRSALRRHLPDFMLPSSFVTLDALPMTPTGKTDRAALPPPVSERQVSGAYVAPRTQLQGRIAAVWRDLLGVEQVGLHDNFFDLGGHSLLLVRLQRRLLEEFEREVPLQELLEHPTVDSVARLLRREAEETPVAEAPDGRADQRQAGRERLQKRLARRGKSAGSGKGSS
jgi:amino acid adenylation domain-containing protein